MRCESIFYYRKAQHGGTTECKDSTIKLNVRENKISKECHKSVVTCDVGAT